MVEMVWCLFFFLTWSVSGGDHDGVGRHIILTGTSPVVAAAVAGVVRVVVVVVVAGVRLGGGDARDPNATEAGRQLRDAAAGAAEETAAAAAAALGAGQSAAGWVGGWVGGGWGSPFNSNGPK